MAQRASDRARMIKALEKAHDPLAADYAKASAGRNRRANCAAVRRLSAAVGRRREIVYSLSRRTRHDDCEAQWVGLRTSDAFGHRVRQDRRAVLQRRLDRRAAQGLYDFENKKVFSPTFTHRSNSASSWPAGRQSGPTRKCAFYVHDVGELHDPERCFTLTAADFARV